MPISIQLPPGTVPNGEPDFFAEESKRLSSYYLHVYWVGMSFLEQRTREEEAFFELQDREELKKRASEGGLYRGLDEAGTVETLQSLHDQPRHAYWVNLFLWYANHFGASIRAFDCAYHCTLRNEFDAVMKFRNKVSAHSAFSWPKDDNKATQNSSLVPMLVWSDTRFVINAWVMSESSGNDTQSSPSDWSWSLTEAHTRLRERVLELLPSPKSKGRDAESGNEQRS